MKINCFPFLEKGDLVGVAAPSARFDEIRLQQGIICLEKFGFQVQVPDQIFGQQRYLAGDDMCRATGINALAADPEIKGIVCARGGFGAMRMLSYLDWHLIQAHPKLFIGFSDATALLTAVMQRANIGVVHGPNLVSLADADFQTRTSFLDTVTGQGSALKIPQGGCVAPGRATGILMGGNLATLTHLVGTQFAPDFSRGVVFLEDVAEPAYKIDRMLTQMKMAGLFSRVRAVVTGTFERCDHPEYLPEILSDIFGEYQVPVLMGLAAGHGGVNLSLPMGCRVDLDADAKTLSWPAKKWGS
ncbi:MAG: LD-carboxypeptidase [Desulfotignum sp.]|nr:LD-carboxypeptidase [Desulfotignum sp.]MCF8087764.1 LD-carboxypeptidase [Desulfotignum sp.]MCF8138880.1 LD-carboxypeptidase [Desulfotignum sp.]